MLRHDKIFTLDTLRSRELETNIISTMFRKQSNLSSLFNDWKKSFEIIITNNKKIPVIVPLNVSTEGSSVIWNGTTTSISIL